MAQECQHWVQESALAADTANMGINDRGIDTEGGKYRSMPLFHVSLDRICPARTVFWLAGCVLR